MKLNRLCSTLNMSREEWLVTMPFDSWIQLYREAMADAD